MAKKAVSYELVEKTVEALVSEGKKSPSYAAIRDRIGFGSFSTIGKLLKQVPPEKFLGPPQNELLSQNEAAKVSLGEITKRFSDSFDSLKQDLSKVLAAQIEEKLNHRKELFDIETKYKEKHEAEVEKNQELASKVENLEIKLKYLEKEKTRALNENKKTFGKMCDLTDLGACCVIFLQFWHIICITFTKFAHFHVYCSLLKEINMLYSIP